MVKQMEEPWRETAIDLVMLVGDGRISQERPYKVNVEAVLLSLASEPSSLISL